MENKDRPNIELSIDNLIFQEDKKSSDNNKWHIFIVKSYWSTNQIIIIFSSIAKQQFICWSSISVFF